MPKPIKLTRDLIDQMLHEFEEALGSLKLTDGKVSYTRALTYEEKKDDKASVLFEPRAYTKMLLLLNSFEDEVAWHGTVTRQDAKTFVVHDIFVYPQEVTGGTVTTDQERYQTWLMQLDDEVFDNLHMQGHSHVNFGTTPSAVDTKFYDSILEQLDDDTFYIFMIFNKKLERTVKIYDMQNNVLYENKDIEIGLLCDNGDFEQFIIDAKDDVVRKTYVATTCYGAKSNATTGSGKDTKKNGGANHVSSQPKLTQYPGYFGGYGGYGGYGSDADIDYDQEIFGKRNDWWNK